MRLFSRRTASPTTSERELTATARLGLAPWRAELERLGLAAEDTVFVANNDGGSIVSGDGSVVTPEIGVVMLTPLRVAYLHRAGDRIASAVADLGDVGKLTAAGGSLEVRVGEGTWVLAGQ